ncbi:MAG TPA: adenine deaminase C-terminal domain-containing protein, partial [Flavisolibacter sp.]|nr:adenine deaminase C-terminal domain-containing protein [Flavisolibacter sp.]
IIIREGSAAKNFEALIGLLQDHAGKIMFCSDDKHPDSLVEGHINKLCARAAARGIDVFKIIRAACVNPVLHYKLKVGLLRQNDFADFILVKDLESFEVLSTCIDGKQVAENGKTLISTAGSSGQGTVNRFGCSKKQVKDISGEKAGLQSKTGIPVIEALDGQLITNKLQTHTTLHANLSIEQDILRIVVVNRYKDAPVAKAHIRNFGLKKGAIASSVAHDSHNIVAIGADDESICRAVNLIIESKGGVSCVGGKTDMLLPLPVAGLMSPDDGYEVANRYAAIDEAAKELGCRLSAPFMTLSFMALLVIPHLKLSDLGLFDGDTFSLIDPVEA